MAQRDLGHDLGDLFQRARAAGEGDERVAQLDHLRLALGHVAGDDQLVDVVVDEARIHEKLRLHAGDMPAGGQHALRQHAHQAGLRPAIDQRVAALPDPSPQLAHRVAEPRVAALVRAQINCDVHRFSSVLRMHPRKNTSCPPTAASCASRNRFPHSTSARRAPTERPGRGRRADRTATRPRPAPWIPAARAARKPAFRHGRFSRARTVNYPDRSAPCADGGRVESVHRRIRRQRSQRTSARESARAPRRFSARFSAMVL